MGRKYGDVTVPEKVYRNQVVGVTCCLCGKEAPNPGGAGKYGDGAWSDGRYGVDAVRICRERGDCYPEFRQIVEEFFDVCPGCWEERVVPWFRSQGVEPMAEETTDGETSPAPVPKRRNLS